MKNVVIICNGLFPKKEYPLDMIRKADYVVCCDGALTKYLRLSDDMGGRLPDMIIGDMDSLTPNVLTRLLGKMDPGEKDILLSRMMHIEEQENNDQTKAFDYAIKHFKDIGDIHIIGATGLREDHTIGNMSLLMEYARKYDLDALGISVDMVSDYSTIFAITDTTSIQVGEGRQMSIFSPDNSLRIKSEGLVWPTDAVIFDNWWKASLNRSSNDTVTLHFNHRSMALIVID
jgi:thiamine pyrophosphokinase